MKVIINFGEKKVVVPCGIDGDISIRELINVATAKYCKLSYNNGLILNSDQVQLRLNNGAVVDPDDRVCDVADDREELFAIFNYQRSNYPSSTTTANSNGDLSSSVTSSNLSSSLSEHDRLMVPSSNNPHEVIVTDADLRTRSLRVKNDPKSNSQQSMTHSSSSSLSNKMAHRPKYSPPTHDATKIQSFDNMTGMLDVYTDEITGDKIFSIILPKENSPLGIHVIPYNHDEQQVKGLLLQNIEDDGRIKRQGILQLNDRIIEINRTNIERCSFDKAQLIFRTALLEPELQLKIVRSVKKPPVPPKPSSFQSNDKTRSTLSEINQNNDLILTDNDATMNSLNTRRLGKIIKIVLTKGNDGLGFKLAARDNPTCAVNPIYVKTIFPKGAAIEDGRLQRGDRLLTVNSIDVTQMSLQETVRVLRETRIGDAVELCISRQHDGSLPQDLVNDVNDIVEKKTMKYDAKPQIMTFDIPLNDTSSAGLGITLKGKTSIVDGQCIDTGIFVKSILTGGAAFRDNRLLPNDQILVINDSSLINLSNLEAASILHEAVRREVHPGHIKVTISRLSASNDEQKLNSMKYIKETDLFLPPPLPPLPVNDDENELDLTTFVPPPILRKPPTQQSGRHTSRLESTQTLDPEIRSSSPRAILTSTRTFIDESPSKSKQIFIQSQNEQHTSDDVDNAGVNPFERETPFRQSISEKRRLTHQPNKQAVQWKQRSFHEGRTQYERKSFPLSTAASIEILTPVIDISDADDDHDLNEIDVHCRYSVARQSEQPTRTRPDRSASSNKSHTPSGLIRSSSFESIPTANEGHEPSNVVLVNDDERKRQAKLRSRACNDSFRQAVDKSYSHDQNVNDNDMNNKDTSPKIEKQRFRFANLFTAKSKRKEHQEETMNKFVGVQQQTASYDNQSPLCPPPPPPLAFSSRQDSTSSSSSSRVQNNDRSSTVFSYSSKSNEQPQGYQPYRFEFNQINSIPLQNVVDPSMPMRYEPEVVHDYPTKSISGKSSVSISSQKAAHPSIPRQFLQTNISGSQSLKQHQPSYHSSILPGSSTRSPYPSTFTVQPAHFTAYSHNIDIPMNASQPQQTRRIGYSATPVYPTSRGYFHVESPANV